MIHIVNPITSPDLKYLCKRNILSRRSAEEWKNRFYIVFEGEEGHGQEEEFALQGEQTLLPEEVSEPGKTLAFEETLGPGLADAS